MKYVIEMELKQITNGLEVPATATLVVDRHSAVPVEQIDGIANGDDAWLLLESGSAFFRPGDALEPLYQPIGVPMDGDLRHALQGVGDVPESVAAALRTAVGGRFAVHTVRSVHPRTTPRK